MLKVQHPQWSEVWVKQVVSHMAGHGLGRKTAALVKRVGWKTRKMAGRKAADAAAGASPSVNVNIHYKRGGENVLVKTQRLDMLTGRCTSAADEHE